MNWWMIIRREDNGRGSWWWDNPGRHILIVWNGRLHETSTVIFGGLRSTTRPWVYHISMLRALVSGWTRKLLILDHLWPLLAYPTRVGLQTAAGHRGWARYSELEWLHSVAYGYAELKQSDRSAGGRAVQENPRWSKTTTFGKTPLWLAADDTLQWDLCYWHCPPLTWTKGLICLSGMWRHFAKRCEFLRFCVFDLHLDRNWTTLTAREVNIGTNFNQEFNSCIQMASHIGVDILKRWLTSAPDSTKLFILPDIRSLSIAGHPWAIFPNAKWRRTHDKTEISQVSVSSRLAPRLKPLWRSGWFLRATRLCPDISHSDSNPHRDIDQLRVSVSNRKFNESHDCMYME